MDNNTDSQSQTVADLEAQLRIYAQDLHDLYLAEMKERRESAEEKVVLQYKLRELSALNSLFQRHLEYRQQLEATIQNLIAQLQELLKQPAAEGLYHKLEHLLAEAKTALSALPQKDD